MSTPESKLETAAANVTNEIAKVKTLWTRWEPYAIGVAGVVLGGLLVHVLKL
jgi:hypothetical protein